MSDHLSVLTLGSSLGVEELRRMCVELSSSGPITRLLVDARPVDGPYSERARALLASHLVVFFFEARVAVLARKEVINHVTESIAAGAGMDIQIFWKEESAMQWLRSSERRLGRGDG